MNKLRVLFTAAAAAVLCAPAAFAQGAAGAAPESHSALWIAAGLGMATAAFGGALGQGRIAGAACEGIARNPGAAGNIRTAMLLGLVFVETLALLTFAIIFAKVK
jgi:F-type H+-transporting ATPase subunit c